MDPNDTLDQLRDLYNAYLDGGLTLELGQNALELFDALDNWIIGGGFLPDEWQR